MRTEAKLTQAQFAEIAGVSQQSIQKWESGVATPDLNKIVAISRYFDVSLDALILGNDNRVVAEMNRTSVIKPQYQNLHDWEFYSANIQVEYAQSTDEGLDVERYEDIFNAVARLPKGEIKKKFGDILFDVVLSAPKKEGYKYVEPSELDKIKELRKGTDERLAYDANALENKIHGAWMGRICGCMLGKTLESIKTDELVPFLKETDNYPMHRYVYRTDLTEEMYNKYKYPFRSRPYADEINGMPMDDDTNYVVLAQEVIRKKGKDFTPPTTWRKRG